MNLKQNIITYTLSLVFLMLYNCTKPVDFTQGEEVEIFPVVETSLVFFEAEASDFIVPSGEDFRAGDAVAIEFFSDEFVEESLIKADFVFNVNNSINRAFRLNITFADEEGEPLEIIFVDVPASTDNVNRTTNFVQSYEGEALERVVQSRVLQFELTAMDGEPIDADSEGQIRLESSGIFSLMIDNK